MIEKDNIQELFSKAFENHASPVRPDLWTGVQAKMAAAGVTGGAVAAKGISAFAKWLIGTAAVTTVGVTAYVVTTMNETEKPAQVTTVATNGNSDQTENEITPIQEETAKTSVENSGNVDRKMIRQTVPYVMDQIPVITEKIDQDVELIDKPVMRVSDNPEVKKSPNTNPTPSTPDKTIPAQPKGSSDNHSNSPASGNEVVEAKKIPAAKIELPNIFTPNGDRANDLCEFVALENVKMVDITILDADGKTVYRSNDLNFAWDGTTLGGEQARIGIYTCLISYVDLGDVAKNKTAYIYLQR